MIKIFLKHEIKRLTKKYVRSKQFREYEVIHDVIVFFNMENLPDVELFIKTLIQDGKNVTAYSFDKKNITALRLPDCYHLLTKDALNFGCIPKKNELLAFKRKQADTLIDLTINPSLILKYLFLNSSADYRIGFDRENAALYDLLIEHNQEQGFSYFLDQMLFYMKSLRTK